MGLRTKEQDALLAPHRDAIIYHHLFKSWPGGDAREIAKIAIAFGMPSHETNINCSGCFGNMLTFIANFLTEEEINEYKQRKGV